jgi:hypothetical protein
MYIGVIDGQGGGVGRAIVSELRARFTGHQVVALGTNALATSAMLRAGANEGATGENAIVRTVPRCDVILGPLGIVLANAMLGEVTPTMASAIGGCEAVKILIPMPQAHVRVAGVAEMPLVNLMADAMEKLQGVVDSNR